MIVFFPSTPALSLSFAVANLSFGRFFVLVKMQEIYNKSKCQHIGEWKSNYTRDKTMQIHTHIVFHSQLAPHKNITAFSFRKQSLYYT